MSKIKMNIWGRDFNLEVYYKKYQGEEVTETQKDSYENFIEAGTEIEQSLRKLTSYIEKEYGTQLQEKKIENIFKYVIPKIIFIPNNCEKRTVALLCNFKFDNEHGLALVYENEKLIDIVLQDEIL